MTATATAPLSMLLTEVTVTAVERISPTFVRAELASFAGADETWWASWLDLADDVLDVRCPVGMEVI